MVIAAKTELISNRNIAEKKEAIPSWERIFPKAIIELFTSQGCSSCPSADALMKTLSSEFDSKAIFIGFHVDYWDYLGWKD